MATLSHWGRNSTCRLGSQGGRGHGSQAGCGGQSWRGQAGQTGGWASTGGWCHRAMCFAVPLCTTLPIPHARTWWVTSTVALSRNMPRTQCSKMCWAVWWSTADSALSCEGGCGVGLAGDRWVRRQSRELWQARSQCRARNRAGVYRIPQDSLPTPGPTLPAHQQHQVSIKVGGTGEVQALALATRQVDAAQAGLRGESRKGQRDDERLGRGQTRPPPSMICHALTCR